MKKTLIALLTLSGAAIAGDVALFDFGGTNVPGSTDKSYTLTDSATGYSITLSSESVLGTSVIFDTDKQAYTSWTDLPSGGNNAYDISTITNSLDAYIGATISATAPTFITGGGKWKSLNITFGGLEAGQSYDIGLITGVPFEGAGTWNSITVNNTVNGDVYKYYANTPKENKELNDSGTTQETLGVKNVTGFSFASVVADEDGLITLTINANGSHNASLNGAAITKVVPEPTTATLSLLALAGLAARRRRASR